MHPDIERLKELSEAPLSPPGNISVNGPHAETRQQAIERLAGVSTLDYVEQRQAEAKNLHMPLAFLDKVVNEAKAKHGGGKPLQGQEIVFPEILPASEPGGRNELPTG